MNRILSALVLSLFLCSSAFAQRAVIVQLPSGQLLGVAYTPAGQIVLTDVTIIKLAPTPNPTPTPPPVTVGKRDIAIIHESGLVTERQASLHVLIRTNPAFSEWVKSRGHRVFVLDQDGKDRHGNASSITQKFLKAKPATQKLPAIVILDQASGEGLYAGDLPTDITVDGITELVKRYGG